MKLFKDKLEFMQFCIQLNSSEVFDFYLSKKSDFLSIENEEFLEMVATKIKGLSLDKDYAKFCADVLDQKPRFSEKIYEKILDKNQKQAKKFFLSLLNSREYDFLFNLLSKKDYLFLEILEPEIFKSIPDNYIVNHFCSKNENKVLHETHFNLIGKIIDKYTENRLDIANEKAMSLILNLQEKGVSIKGVNLLQLFMLSKTRDYLLQNEEMLKDLYENREWKKNHNLFQTYRYYDDWVNRDNQFYISMIEQKIEKTVACQYLDISMKKGSVDDFVLVNKSRVKI